LIFVATIARRESRGKRHNSSVFRIKQRKGKKQV